MNKLNESAYAPYSSGASHRASNSSRKFEAEMARYPNLSPPLSSAQELGQHQTLSSARLRLRRVRGLFGQRASVFDNWI
jgi:hypothetical protein